MGGFGSQAFLGCVHDDDALKPAVFVFLPDEIVDDRTAFAKVWQETQLGNEIDHINVIGVMGLARLDEGYARVVEYADAESLRSVYRRAQTLKRPLSAPLAVAIVADACMGVHYAHELGIAATGSAWVHGGLRPETLQVSFQGMAKVTGYGAQALSDALRKSNSSSGLVARDTYTAPEQAFGGRAAATAQSDVYALGCVLFEALTGKPPISSETDLAEAMIKDELGRPSLQGVTDAMVEVILTATKKRSRDRYATALAMRDDLQSLCSPATAAELRSYLDELFPPDVVPRATRSQMLKKARADMPAPTGKLLLEMPAAPQTQRSVRAPTQDDLAIAAAVGTPVSGSMAPSWSMPTTTQSMVEVTPHAQRLPEPSRSLPPSPPMVVPRQQVLPAPSNTAVVTRPMAIPKYTAFPAEPVPTPVVVNRTPMGLVLAVGLATGVAIAFGLVLLLKPTPPAPVIIAAPVATPPTPLPPPATIDPVVPVVAVAAVPPPVEPPPVKATGPGTLVISSDPPLELVVDGKVVGTGEASVPLSPGKHKVSGRGGGASTQRVVTIKPGQTTRIELDIGRGTIAVIGEDGVSVSVDGKKVGTTPMSPIAVTEGTHKVTVRRGNAEYSQRVPVRAGTESFFEFKLHGG
jgi:eukaryotic-like serine/threonine-protein kinase